MSGQEADDIALMAAAAAGSADAVGALFARHGAAMQRAARLMTADRTLAADVVQDACIAVLRGARSFRAEVGEVRPWLLSVTRNTARRALRTRAGREDVPHGLDPSAEHAEALMSLGQRAGWGALDPERALAAAEDADRLARAIAALPIDEREVLVLRDVEELEGAATARALGLGLAAMKSRLHRARLALMALLRTTEGDLMAAERKVGTLRCGEVLARLGDYVDGELPTGDVAAVETHVRGCPVCERFGGRYAGTLGAMRRALGATDPLDPALVARLRDEHLRSS